MSSITKNQPKQIRNQLNSTETKQLDTELTSSVINAPHEDFAEKPNRSVRIIEIKQEKTKYTEDRIQDFEISYAGTCIAVEGSPKDLTILFKKMQHNPEFAEDVFRQARALSE